jgi:hypothetical protein
MGGSGCGRPHSQQHGFTTNGKECAGFLLSKIEGSELVDKE